MNPTKKITQNRQLKAGATGVLCGTDFSPAAVQAANVAAALARRLQMPLELVHATAIPADPQPREKLSAEAGRLRQQETVVRDLLLSGNADEELVRRAKPATCRMVVVSSLGKRGAARWLLGSVSERTAERAPVPTLVVRDAAPLEAWTRGERPLKVFVAFNFTATSEAALRWVKELLAIGPCDIVIGLINGVPEQRARLGGTGPLPLENNPPEVQAILERDLTARATELLGSGSFRTRIEANWGRPDVRLAEMAKEERADLIVVGSHQFQGFERMWHTSASRGLLQGAAMSVAVVPLAHPKSRDLGIARSVQRVLVTTDFSDVANHAIPHAYSLVHRGGTVHLVHVIHPHELPGGKYLQGLQDGQFDAKHAKVVKACAGKLRALIPAESIARGICSEIEVAEHAQAATAILQAGERLAVDVICLGTHGSSGLLKTFLGSVTQEVLAKGTRPILVVRPPKP